MNSLKGMSENKMWGGGGESAEDVYETESGLLRSEATGSRTNSHNPQQFH